MAFTILALVAVAVTVYSYRRAAVVSPVRIKRRSRR